MAKQKIILIGIPSVFDSTARMETVSEYKRAGKTVRMTKVWVCTHPAFKGNRGRRFCIEGTYARHHDCYEIFPESVTLLS